MVVGRKLQLVVDVDVPLNDERPVSIIIDAIQEGLDNGTLCDDETVDLRFEVVLAEVNN